ncbi:AMP-binding protein, partial [Erythrobacter donghaensis]
MHPSVHAQNQADKPAIIMAGSGLQVSYAELDRRSNQVAQYLRQQGVGIGDTVALCLENRAEYFDIVWGAQRAGLIFVAISNRLTADEISYILQDSGAKLLFTSDYLGAHLPAIASACPHVP